MPLLYPTYSRKLNTEELVQSIFISFGDEKNEYTLFDTTLLANNPDSELKQRIQELDLKYPIKPKHASHYNSRQAGLCRNGHLNVVTELIEHEADVNHATNNGVTAFFMASQFATPLAMGIYLLMNGLKIGK